MLNIIISTVNSYSSNWSAGGYIDDDRTASPVDTEIEADHIHNVNVHTHGRRFNLELSPIEHLLSKRSALENVWYADGYPTNVSYTPGPKVRMSY